MTGTQTDGTNRCVVYVHDSLRYDRVGAAQDDESYTPNIDAMTRDGVRFENAYSQAIWTYPSSASLFTGLYPDTHGSHQYNQTISDSLPHLADGTGDTNLHSACFSTTFGVSPERGFEQEFDEFHHIDAGLRPDVMDKLNEKLLPWIDEHAHTDFLLVVWAMGTHHPYVTPESAKGLSEEEIDNDPEIEGTSQWMNDLPAEEAPRVKSLYDETVRYADERFGDLVERLKSHRIYESTDIILTSDHGEVFDEHVRMEFTRDLVKRLVGVVDERKLRRYGLFEPSAFLGHQAVFPFDELIHVPLVVKPGADWDRPTDSYSGFVELVDVYPTVQELLGQKDAPRSQGTSLCEYLRGEAHKDRVYSCSQLHKGIATYRSIKGSEYKYLRRSLEGDIWAAEPKRVAQSVFSYLAGNNHVLVNGADNQVKSSTRAKALREELKAHVETCRKARDTLFNGESTGRVEVDEETERRLEDLGYK